MSIYAIPAGHLSLYRFLREKVTQFLWERLENMRWSHKNWTRPEISEWVRWHCENLFFVAAGDGSQIAGAVAFRIVESPARAIEDPYHYNRGADLIWIDQGATSSAAVTLALWKQGLKQIPRAYPMVGYEMERRGLRVRVHKTENFTRRLASNAKL